MRDAFVAALSFHVFHKYADRIQMANIAQVVNVLQAMILTKDDKMLLTPTYHVFDMYRVHQDATHLPLDILSDTKLIRERNVPMVSASASKNKSGVVHLSLANDDLDSDRTLNIDLGDTNLKSVSGRMLTAKNITDHNTFDKPDVVKPINFSGAKISKGKLQVTLPAKSIVVLAIQ
jgi:alpha-N-arabinofuranosidase